MYSRKQTSFFMTKKSNQSEIYIELKEIKDDKLSKQITTQRETISKAKYNESPKVISENQDICNGFNSALGYK